VGFGQCVWKGLRRDSTVTKSATARASERPTVREHYESFAVEHPLPAIHKILLVDDVITKGRTLLAAAARLQEQFPHADVRAFALIRTLGFVPRVDQLAETCHGVVRWAGGDARREP
jgi:predicted amidophosphoribosyltransferase